MVNGNDNAFNYAASENVAKFANNDTFDFGDRRAPAEGCGARAQPRTEAPVLGRSDHVEGVSGYAFQPYESFRDLSVPLPPPPPKAGKKKKKKKSG